MHVVLSSRTNYQLKTFTIRTVSQMAHKTKLQKETKKKLHLKKKKIPTSIVMINLDRF